MYRPNDESPADTDWFADREGRGQGTRDRGAGGGGWGETAMSPRDDIRWAFLESPGVGRSGVGVWRG